MKLTNSARSFPIFRFTTKSCEFGTLWFAIWLGPCFPTPRNFKRIGIVHRSEGPVQVTDLRRELETVSGKRFSEEGWVEGELGIELRVRFTQPLLRGEELIEGKLVRVGKEACMPLLLLLILCLGRWFGPLVVTV